MYNGQVFDAHDDNNNDDDDVFCGYLFDIAKCNIRNITSSLLIFEPISHLVLI